MNERQALIVVRDQFALKRLTDEQLKVLRPAYQQLVKNITARLSPDVFPTLAAQQQFWLLQQARTIEAQFQQLGEQINSVIPAGQQQAWEAAVENAEDFLMADDIVKETLSGKTTGGQTVSGTGNLPLVGDSDRLIRPSITKQQLFAASKEGGFGRITIRGKDGKPQSFAATELIRESMRKQAGQLTDQLRAGFLGGETNEEIGRRITHFFGGNANRKEAGRTWAMTQAVVRTSMAQASQAAHDAFYEANQDWSWTDDTGVVREVKLVQAWEWDASLDTRLCPQCAPLDGLRWKNREDVPTVPIHFSCRCKVLPLTPTQLARRERGDLPEGSYLERTPVKYTKGKRNPAPAGWTGEGAYKRPQRIDGKYYWVRRRDMGKGKTLAGDMLKDMKSDENKLAILGSKDMLKKWNERVNTEKWKDRPQDLLRELLGSGGSGGTPPPRPPRPPKGPKPTPKKPTPAPKPAATPGRQFAEEHQFHNGKLKLSTQQIGDSLENLAKEEGLAGRNMRRLLEFQQKGNISVAWSTGREKLQDFDHWKAPGMVSSLQDAAKRGTGAAKIAADMAKDLERGSTPIWLAKVGRISGSGAGHAMDGGGFIVMKQEAQFVPIAGDALKLVRKTAADSVKAAAEGRPSFIVLQDLYQRSGKTSLKTKEGWIGTYVHEMGHQVHFLAGKPSLRDHLPADIRKRAAGNGPDALAALGELRKLGWNPTKYGTTNEMERFAETFTQYVLAPDELLKANPSAYRWVEEAIDKTLNDAG